LEYKVFVTTWLGFGVNEARKEYLNRMIDASSAPGVEELPDPCLPKGLLATIEGKEIEDEKELALANRPYLHGTGRFDECLRQVYPLLGKDSPCHDAPCLLKGVHVPGIDFSVNHFVGISEYWHTTHDIFQMGLDKKAYDLQTYQKAVTDFCSLDWDSIEGSVEGKKWGDKVDEEKAIGTCFKASWLINVLHEGIGVPRIGIEASAKTGKGFMDGAFQPVDKIDDIEVSWTLGKIILYAASQIPPTSDSPSSLTPLPVGFGSNIPNRPYEIPADFQYADPLFRYNPTNTSAPTYPDSAYNSTTGEWQSSSSGSLHPVNHPFKTMFVFLLIASLLTYLLLGRDKRKRLLRRSKDLVQTFRGTRSRKWIPMLNLPIHNSPSRGAYERVNTSSAQSPYAASPVFELDLEEGDSADDWSDGSDRRGDVTSPVGGQGWRNEEGRLGVLGSLSASAGGSAVSLHALGKTRSRERYGRSRNASPQGRQ
jgi:golgi apyrase